MTKVLKPLRRAVRGLLDSLNDRDTHLGGSVPDATFNIQFPIITITT